MAYFAVTLPALLLALASAATAQTTAREPDLTGIRRSAHGLTGAAGRLAGFGADYAVQFDAHGMQFQPALGARAVRDQRLELELAGIARGGAALPVEAVVPPVQRGAAAVYRRSAAVEERYEVRAEGVEQSFVFTALPGRGDLVVRCRLAGELAPFGEVAAGGGLQFLVPGLGGVSVGAVTGIDAAGDRCQGAVRLVDGQLELSLPAAFVDTAALPLVLDPLVGARIDAATGGLNDTEPAVAFDATSSNFLLVWRQVLSATSASVLGRTWRPAVGLGAAQVLGTGPVLRRPRVVSHNLANRWLVIWERGDSVVGMTTIASRIVNGDGTLGPAQDLTPAASNCVEPDLSGNPGLVDNLGVMVWREVGVGLFAQCYALPSGTQGLSLLPAFAIVPDPAARFPRVSKSGTGAQVVAFARPGELVVQACQFPGVLVGAPYAFAVGAAHLPQVDIDGAQGSFLAVLDQLAPGRADRDIRGVQIDLQGGQLQLRSTAVLASSTADDFAPKLALLGPKYLAVWSRTTGFLDYEVRGSSVGLTGCVPCGAEFAVTGALATDVEPMVGARYTGGSSVPGALVVWASHDLSRPLPGDIHAIEFTPFAATPPQALWAGCGRPVTIAATSSLSIGNAAFGYSVSTTDAAAGLAFVSLGIVTAPLGCGGCSFVGPTALGVIPLAGGQGSYAVPMPCSVRLLGVPLDAQAAILGTVTNFCPLAAQLSTSNAIRLLVGE
ncbi:MAG: hypothetical protein JNK49_21865 [Planctomycetes bacterium]|nr:hypothetical protein [Planctomycetota bacterium]